MISIDSSTTSFSVRQVVNIGISNASIMDVVVLTASLCDIVGRFTADYSRIRFYVRQSVYHVILPDQSIESIDNER